MKSFRKWTSSEDASAKEKRRGQVSMQSFGPSRSSAGAREIDRDGLERLWDSESKSKEELLAAASRNFSPSFLKLAERKFYVYAYPSASRDTYVLDTRDLPDLLRDLKQPEWFIKVLQEEIREARRKLITFTDLLVVVNYKGKLPDEELYEAFQTVDTDQTGTLSKEELRRVLCDRGKYPLSEKEFQAVFNLMDNNQSDGVSLHEFIQMWKVGRRGKQL
uniref:EF-hand domain-containing protein n=1 Tax=Rhodosorus marinus TaxID=101924 RepID=A0A7S0BPB9_9RHOD|mmetsp:Transcript_3222/g.4632  ORF Transcript_3222/g.4632 Transcript_3222/m.4632 type:complete len:219 (+) Transcript_3222:100-756(+)